MAVKYVKEFEFGGSVSSKKPPGMKKDLAPAKPFKGEYQGYAKGGMVKTLDKMMRERRAEMPARAAASERGMPMAARANAPARPMMDRMEDRRPMAAVEERPMMGQMPMRRPMMKKGGLAYAKGPKAEKKVSKVMREYKKGELHSGKDGPVVKNPKQAMAIALSEARRMKKADGGVAEKKEPFRGPYKKKGREQGKKDRMEKWAEQRMRHAEKHAPGLSLDMPDEPMAKYAKGGAAKHSDVKMDKAMMKKAVHKHERVMHPGKPLTKLKKGGMPAYGRKPMYGGGKC